jgi:hypothetical protein
LEYDDQDAKDIHLKRRLSNTYKGKGKKVVPMLNEAPRHEDALE